MILPFPRMKIILILKRVCLISGLILVTIPLGVCAKSHLDLTHLSAPKKVSSISLLKEAWKVTDFDIAQLNSTKSEGSSRLKFSPDMKFLAYHKLDYLCIYQVSNLKLLHIIPIEQLGTLQNYLFDNFYWSNDAAKIFYCNKLSIHSLDIISKRKLSYYGFGQGVHSFTTVSNDSKIYCVGSNFGDSELRILDSNSFKLLNKRSFPVAWGVLSSPTGEFVMISSKAGKITFYDTLKNEDVFSIDVGHFLNGAWSPNGRYFAAISNFKSIMVIDLKSKKIVLDRNVDKKIERISWCSSSDRIYFQDDLPYADTNFILITPPNINPSQVN